MPAATGGYLAAQAGWTSLTGPEVQAKLGWRPKENIEVSVTGHATPKSQGVMAGFGLKF